MRDGTTRHSIQNGDLVMLCRVAFTLTDENKKYLETLAVLCGETTSTVLNDILNKGRENYASLLESFEELRASVKIDETALKVPDPKGRRYSPIADKDTWSTRIINQYKRIEEANEIDRADTFSEYFPDEIGKDGIAFAERF